MTLQKTCTMKSNLKNKLPKQDLHDKNFSGLASVDSGKLTRPTHLDGKIKSIEIERGELVFIEVISQICYRIWSGQF